MSKKAEKILNTTIRLFLDSGARRTTMDDIAEHSGASKVTIYKYFTDKDTLYLEAGRHILSAYMERLEAVLSSGEPLVRKLCDYLDAVSDFTDSGKYELCLELTRYNHELESEQKLYLRTYKQTMLALIDEGLARGLLKNTLDRDSIFYYIDMGVVYYQRNPEYRGKMRGDAGFRQHFMQFIIGNIFTDAKKLLIP